MENDSINREAMQKEMILQAKHIQEHQKKEREKALKDLDVLLDKIEKLRTEWEELKERAPDMISKMMEAFGKEALSSDKPEY